MGNIQANHSVKFIQVEFFFGKNKFNGWGHFKMDIEVSW